jgi:hypothetical protein
MAENCTSTVLIAVHSSSSIQIEDQRNRTPFVQTKNSSAIPTEPTVSPATSGAAESLRLIIFRFFQPPSELDPSTLCALTLLLYESTLSHDRHCSSARPKANDLARLFLRYRPRLLFSDPSKLRCSPIRARYC